MFLACDQKARVDDHKIINKTACFSELFNIVLVFEEL